MSSPKVFIFAPVAEARDSHQRLEAEGCELRVGQPSWDAPQANSEPELVRMTQGAHALMGTSIRNVPISRKIIEGCGGRIWASARDPYGSAFFVALPVAAASDH